MYIAFTLRLSVKKDIISFLYSNKDGGSHIDYTALYPCVLPDQLDWCTIKTLQSIFKYQEEALCVATSACYAKTDIDSQQARVHSKEQISEVTQTKLHKLIE